YILAGTSTLRGIVGARTCNTSSPRARPAAPVRANFAIFVARRSLTRISWLCDGVRFEPPDCVASCHESPSAGPRCCDPYLRPYLLVASCISPVIEEKCSPTAPGKAESL